MQEEEIQTGQQQHQEKLFLLLVNFACEETRRVWNDNDLAGMPQKEGIAANVL